MNFLSKNSDIVLKSTQDTVPGVEFKKPNQSFIPEELFLVINNNVQLSKDMSMDSKNYYHVLSGLANFNNVKKDIYWYLHKLLLYLEYYQCIMDMKKYNLSNQKIERSKRRSDEMIFRVPALSEERQSFRLYDKVEIIQIGGKNSTCGYIKFIGRDYIGVKVNERFKKDFRSDHRYNIEFHYFDWTINNLNHVLNKISEEKLITMLFPVKHLPHLQEQQPIQWINQSICKNPEQQQAIINILNRSAQPAPYILFGPPGTGKTSTLVEAVCQILKSNSSNRVLICTPSNAAADEIAIRLYKNSIDEKIMYRMYSKSKNSKDINENIQGFSNCSDAGSVFISKSVLLKKKVVISTLSTCIRLEKYNLRDDHFSHLFCDEAGQATELETLIPLPLMSYIDNNGVGRFCGQIVLAGDPKQLGPVVLSRLAKPLLGKSMLERLIDWGPYKKSIKKYDPIYITKLLQNYRSHPAILYLPNKLFYDDELIPKGDDKIKRGEGWSGLNNKKFPILFHAVKGNEKRESSSPSVYNDSEIDVTLNYVRRLIGKKLGGDCVTMNDIGIITPYKLQKNKIQRRLEKENWQDISVGTVELFQGQEREIIIFSTVRTKLYMNGNNIHIGHLSDPKRFNVAITRARALLIVIGDPRILEHDKYWRAFIQYCIDNNSCYGEKFTLSKEKKENEIRKLVAKKHTVTVETSEIGNEEPIEEKSDDDDDDDDKSEFENRRRRLPIGPHPETSGSLNNLQNDVQEEREKILRKLKKQIIRVEVDDDDRD